MAEGCIVPSKPANRRSCPTSRKQWLIEQQNGLCAYCLTPFGSVIRHRNRLKISAINFDHAMPFSFTNGNDLTNWVAACNFCNMIKGNKVFQDFESIRTFCAEGWERRRMSVEWLAPVSSELDPERWAVKFGTYLAGMGPHLAGSIRWVKPYTRQKRRVTNADIFPPEAAS